MGILKVILVRCSLMFQKRHKFSVSTVAKKLSEMAASSQRMSTRLDILSEMRTLPLRTSSDRIGYLLNWRETSMSGYRLRSLAIVSLRV